MSLKKFETKKIFPNFLFSTFIYIIIVAALVKTGPISISVDATKWKAYESGMFLLQILIYLFYLFFLH